MTPRNLTARICIVGIYVSEVQDSLNYLLRMDDARLLRAYPARKLPAFQPLLWYTILVAAKHGYSQSTNDFRLFGI